MIAIWRSPAPRSSRGKVGSDVVQTVQGQARPGIAARRDRIAELVAFVQKVIDERHMLINLPEKKLNHLSFCSVCLKTDEGGYNDDGVEDWIEHMLKYAKDFDHKSSCIVSLGEALLEN